MSFLDRLGQKLGRLLEELPESVQTDLTAGQRELDRGNPSAAMQSLQRVVEAAPKHAHGWYLLGVAQLRQRLAREAVDTLQQAARLAREVPYLLTLARAQREAGLASDAVQTYRRILSDRVDEELLDQVYGGLGEIYLDQGRMDHAMRELRKAVACGEGRDLRLMGLLGLAQLGDSQLELARQSLGRAAAAVPVQREVLVGLARALIELGEAEEARHAAVRLLQDHPHDVDGRCLLARALLMKGDLQAAQQELLRALERAPHTFEVHRLLAQVHLQADNRTAAIHHLRTALSPEFQPPEAGTGPLRQLLILQLEQGTGLDAGIGPDASPDPGTGLDAGTGPDASPDPGTDPRFAAEARRLLDRYPDDPLGLACLALVSASPAREALMQRSLHHESYGAYLARALMAMTGNLDEAATAARAALRVNPVAVAPRRLLDRIYQRMSGAVGPTAFYPALRRVHQLLLAQPDLGPLATEVTRIQAVFDRPLMVLVMGEFNSGKSTFVNALIGEKVAPMGVTPTTATINILKYGERRGARVVWRDDREQSLPWDDVAAFLGGLGRTEARQIRLVELMYPSEELLRVNVVDTPGLNSMIDEHEETAREYMTQADAVIWLFSAGQAGKQTEQQALELLRLHRLKTVGVLNKIDRLSPEELAQVRGHLQREFADLVEEVVPVAARPALEALSAGDTDSEPLRASGFPALRTFLEQHLFTRSRRIKREVCQRRLDAVLDQAIRQAGEVVKAASSALQNVERSSQVLHTWRIETDWLERERGALRAAVQRVYQEAAAEVLDFVRPRSWVFGEHRATRADRDFLLDALMDGLGRMGEASAARVVERLRQHGRQLQQELLQALTAPGLLALAPRVEAVQQTVLDRQAVIRQQVHARYQAFVRGFLQGGLVDRFFEQLPRLELGQEAIYRALTVDGPDVDRELMRPLVQWYQETLDALLQQLARLQLELELLRMERERRIVTPLAALQHELGCTTDGDA